jgi:hypothetical protein
VECFDEIFKYSYPFAIIMVIGGAIIPQALIKKGHLYKEVAFSLFVSTLKGN